MWWCPSTRPCLCRVPRASSGTTPATTASGVLACGRCTGRTAWARGGLARAWLPLLRVLRALAAAASQQAAAAASGGEEAAPAAPAAAQAGPAAPVLSQAADAPGAAHAQHCFWCARPYFSTWRPISWFKADGRRWCQACKAARKKALHVYASSEWPARPSAASGACPNDGVGGGCSACILSG